MKQMTVFFFLFISCLVLAPNPLAARNVGLVHPASESEAAPGAAPGPEGQNESNGGHAFVGGANVLGGGSGAQGRPRLPAIERVCRLAKDDKLCVGSLQRDPDLIKDDAKSLAFEIIKVALSNATDISQHVKQLVTNTKFSPALQQGMSDCQQQFVDVADQLDDCLNALSNGKVNDVGEWLRTAVAAADTCIDALQGVEQILVKKTETFRRLCENALAINRALANNPAMKI